MQRVAGDLGFTKMSLYRHVPGKTELLSIMIDTAVGEPPDLSGVPGGWRPRLVEFVRQLAGIWRQHPWIPAVTVGSRVMGPREAGWIESAVAALAGTGLTGDERLAAVFLLFGHVRNTQSMATAGTQPWSGGSELAEHIRSHTELSRPLRAPRAGRHAGRAAGQHLVPVRLDPPVGLPGRLRMRRHAGTRRKWPDHGAAHLLRHRGHPSGLRAGDGRLLAARGLTPHLG